MGWEAVDEHGDGEGRRVEVTGTFVQYAGEK